tara:strand:- start:356 stop:673 length:318 start_codon:yes stop_codon:yes gene_type:complete
MYKYPKAGKHAPPEVRAAIERWRKQVPPSIKARIPLLYWLLGDSTMPYKMSKPDAKYGPAPARYRGQVCGNCRFAYQKVVDPSIHICSQMEGRINLGLWCRLWKA